MRVLVTGGAGFIGSHIVSAYRARGDEVVVVDDLSSGAADRVAAGSELIVADVADPDTVGMIATLRPEIVVHAAAQVSVARSVTDPARDASVNVVGTRHVVAGAQQAGARRIVFLSSGGAIYGEADGADETGPIAPQSPYGRNKRLAEIVVEGSTIEHAIARLSNVYGPGQRADLEGGVVAIFAEALRQGRPVAIHGSGGQVRDFLHATDAAHAVLRLGDAPMSGTWNVATAVATSIRELLDRLEGLLGPAIEIRAEPPRAGDVGHSVLAIDRIWRDLAWQPAIDLEHGLAGLVGNGAATRD